MTRGYFAVGIQGGKIEANVGTLWRSAHLYGAAFVFAVGRLYRRQATDTPNVSLHTPLFHFADLDDLIAHLPYGCPLVGVEMADQAAPLQAFEHPVRAAYLLGAEDTGLPEATVAQCHHLVQIETARPQSLNVAVAGSLVLHDRHVKALARRAVAA